MHNFKYDYLENPNCNLNGSIIFNQIFYSLIIVKIIKLYYSSIKKEVNIKLIILGIDPGLHFSGFGIIKKEDKKIILIEHGFLKLNPKKSIAERLGEFHEYFDHKIKIFNITDVSLETPFLHKNAQNFLKLGYLRGILYLLANNSQLKIHEFSPREIKNSITGYGGAGKDQVARMVIKLFPTLQMPSKFDITDAIAVTLCGAWNKK